MEKHNGRRLTLQFNRGLVDLNACFYPVAKQQHENGESKATNSQSKLATTRRHILQVTTFQMTVLMLFNKQERWLFEV